VSRRNSLSIVPNRRRCGFSSGIVRSTTTVRIFLCASMPATFWDVAVCWYGSSGTRAKKITHPTCYDRSCQVGWRHRMHSKDNAPDQVHRGLTTSRVPTILAVHAWLIVHAHST
jgi:hypothetical protein